MKGGNAVIVFALQALHDAGVLHDRPITVFLTGDEEQPGALPLTRLELIEEARRSSIALGFEGASGPASATVARRGVSAWRLDVEARTGHSSRIFSDTPGYGAVYEAARILDAFRRALAGEPDLTLNPGVLAAGAEAGVDADNAEGRAAGKSNIIAARAVATGDLRFLTQDQLEMARSTMRNIARQNLPGTRATLVFEDRYPAMAPSDANTRLLRVFDAVSRDLGTGTIHPDDPAQRGAADVSFVAPFVAAMDGLGPQGAGAHAEGESLSIPSVRIATQRAALLIYRLTHPTN